MKVSRVLLGSALVLLLAACGNNSPVDPTDPTVTTDPTDPTVTTDPTTPIDPTVTTDPSTPAQVDLNGTWTGTTTSNQFGPEQTTLTLTQSGATISGTMSIVGVDENGSPAEFEEDVTGTLTGSTAALSATYPITYTENGVPVDQGEVEYQLSGTVSGTTYSGTLTLAFDNGEQGSGTFTFTKGGTTTDPTDPTVSISGTVSAPTGIDVTGTLVGACLQSDTECTEVVEAPPLDITGAYSIAGLQAAPYNIIAFKDVDGNGLSAGDYIGGVLGVTPPESSANFTLELYTGSANTTVQSLANGLLSSNKLQYRRVP